MLRPNTRRDNNQAREDYPVETDVYPISVNGQPNPEMRLALLGFPHDALVNAP